MRLIPRRPPGRCDRKERHHACDVRRLRAEGHTLESIRLALLDAGVSVSVSTIRREVARSPSQWELDHAHEAASSMAESPVSIAAPHVTPSPLPLEASDGQPTSSFDCELGQGQIKAADVRGTFAVLVNISRVLHRLRRARRPP